MQAFCLIFKRKDIINSNFELKDFETFFFFFLILYLTLDT